MSDVSTARERALAAVLLLGVVGVWGSTFVLVKSAFADVSPLLFNLLRMTVATVALLLTNWRSLGSISRSALKGGALAGLLLGAGYQLQTAGLARTTAIKAAFLTGMIVVFVPFLAMLPGVRRPGVSRPRPSAFFGAGLAFAGLVLLTTPAGTTAAAIFRTIGVGDLLTLGCALAFAGHLMTLSRLSELPAAQISTLQIGVASLLMLITLPLEGRTTLHLTARLVFALLLTGLVATALAFSIQTWAQRHLPATTTALLMTLEPVFALAFSMMFLSERLSGRALAGAALILAGIAVTELMGLRRPVALDGSAA